MLERSARVAVSAVIPVHNAEHDLSLCLQSLARSGAKPLECIIVDDASTDASARVAVELGAKVIRMASRLGPASARNLGAAAARASVLVFLDSDVSVHPDTLERIALRFENEPDLDALFGSYDD